MFLLTSFLDLPISAIRKRWKYLNLVLVGISIWCGGQAFGQSEALFLPNRARVEGFGQAVVNTGRYVAVGAPDDGVKGNNAGAVYVFDAETRSLVSKIYGYQTSAGARFGSSIAISGSILVVGSPGKQGGQGEMSWYSFPSGTPIGVFPGFYMSARSFGASLAMSGSLVAIGAPETTVILKQAGQPDQTFLRAGIVVALDLRNYLFVREYKAADPEEGALFCTSVACDGNQILVGAPRASGLGGAEQGAAYLFDFALPGSTAQLGKIQPPEGQAGEQFGSSLVLESGTAFIGAPLRANATGAVYPMSLAGLSLQAPLLGSQAGDQFGAGLSLNRSRLAVGAPGDSSNAEGAGAVWYYAKTTNLSGAARVTPSNFQAGEGFGRHVSLAGDSLAVAATLRISDSLTRGAVHRLPGYPLNLGLEPVYTKGQEAPNLPGALLQKAIRAQWSANDVPIVLAPVLNPKGKGIWSFDALMPTRLLSTDQSLGSGPEIISDVFEHHSNSVRYGITRVGLKGPGVNASNRQAVLFGGQPLLRTGSPLPGGPGATVKTFGPILQSLASGQIQMKLNASRSLGTNASNDSLLWVMRPAIGDWLEKSLIIREGITTTTTNAVTVTLGEISPHTAIAQEENQENPHYALVAGLIAPTTSNQALFVDQTDSPTLSRGQAAPGGGTFQTFLGVTLQADHYLVHATLRTGSGVTTNTNEGLWSNRNGSAELVLRKGTTTPGLPEGVSVRKFLAYALAETGVVLAHCQMGGRGINTRNDVVLLMVESDGKVTTLEAEGNGLSDTSGGRINVMQRLDVADDGSYQLLASLSGTSVASNQALLQGKAISSAIRPRVLVRKNDLLTGFSSRIRAIEITPSSRVTGALGGGLQRTLSPGGALGTRSLITLEFLDKSQALYQHGTVAD
jgi:hypothetical protein